MKKVKRYSIWADYTGEITEDVRSDGYWVQYDDHADVVDRMADRIRELEAQLQVLTNDRDNWRGAFAAATNAQAASEPVAWAVDYISDYGDMGRLFLTDKRQSELYEKAGHTITPLYDHPRGGVAGL